MADLSLDEFIKKNNVKVRVNNTGSSGAVKKTQIQVQGQRGQGYQRPQKKSFDARQKLNTKVVSDARNKIVNIKKTGSGDARNRIVQKQVAKGTFDVRSLLQRKAQTPGSGGGGPGGGGDGGPAGGPKRPTGPRGAGRAFNVQPNQTMGAGGISITKTVNQGAGKVMVTRTGLSVTRPNPGQVNPRLQQHVPMPPLNDAAIPIIQIRNDRYKQPVAPPAPTLQYYSPPEEAAYYPSRPDYQDLDFPQPEPVFARLPPPGAATLSRQGPTLTTKIPPKSAPTAAKRRSEEISGPLRLGKTGTQSVDANPYPVKRQKPAVVEDQLEVIDLENDVDYISPLQGFRIVVSNLFSSVTQDDIIELFGAVGPLKKARLLKTGSAEVVYVNKSDALSAVQKYHSRELDGQAMYVKMTTPVGAVVRHGEPDPDITGEALRLYKRPSEGLNKAPVEVPTIHRALFKPGPPGPNKSVRFTVKI